MRQLLTGVEGADNPSGLLVDFFGRHVALGQKLAGAGRQLSDRNIYSAGAKKLGTNINVGLNTNLTRLIRKFVYARCTQAALTASAPGALGAGSATAAAVREWVRAASRALLYHLHGWPTTQCKQPHVAVEQLPLHLRQDVERQRRILGAEPIGAAWWSDKWGECHARAVRYGVWVNCFLQRNGEPLRGLLPLCGVKAHFITIDMSVLHGVLRDAGYMGADSAQH